MASTTKMNPPMPGEVEHDIVLTNINNYKIMIEAVGSEDVVMVSHLIFVEMERSSALGSL